MIDRKRETERERERERQSDMLIIIYTHTHTHSNQVPVDQRKGVTHIDIALINTNKITGNTRHVEQKRNNNHFNNYNNNNNNIIYCTCTPQEEETCQICSKMTKQLQTTSTTNNRLTLHD